MLSSRSAVDRARWAALAQDGACRGRGGSVITPYLVGAGVGRGGIVDHDTVFLSAAHRPVLYATLDLGQPKAHAARDRLWDLNPDIDTITHPQEAVLRGGEAGILSEVQV